MSARTVGSVSGELELSNKIKYLSLFIEHLKHKLAKHCKSLSYQGNRNWSLSCRQRTIYLEQFSKPQELLHWVLMFSIQEKFCKEIITNLVQSPKKLSLVCHQGLFVGLN